MTDPILEIKDLTVETGGKTVIDSVSLDLYPGRVTALVGESGSGKTLTALAVLDLLPGSAVRKAGRVLFGGEDIFAFTAEGKRRLRGNDIAMVFQEPFTALNPVMRAGAQIAESVAAHMRFSSREVRERVSELLAMVRLKEGTADRYPHELSGGERQRVVLAMALSCDPRVLILDEPTTALDVSIQKEILDLISEIRGEKGFAVFFITHDFSVVDMVADEVSVLRGGKLLESGSTEKILDRPEHPYTRRLIECVPRLGDKRRRLPEVRGV